METEGERKRETRHLRGKGRKSEREGQNKRGEKGKIKEGEEGESRGAKMRKGERE